MPQCVTAVYWSEEVLAVADVLRQLSDQFNKIDNGHCTICHRHRLYDTRGNNGPCENAECLSHRIAQILDRYEPPSRETLERIPQNCEKTRDSSTRARVAAERAATEICDYCGADDADRVVEIIERCFSTDEKVTRGNN